MNSISEYFGSGQRSSATIRSRRSATSRTCVHRRDDRVAHVVRVLDALGVPRGGPRWPSRARGSPRTNSSIRPSVSLASSTTAGLAQLGQVAHGRRQEHRARDRRRGLGLDVELRHVLLDEDLVAGLELALATARRTLEHQVDRLLRRRATAARPASMRRLQQPALLGLGVPLLGVVVAAEDDLLVRRVGRALTTSATASSRSLLAAELAFSSRSASSSIASATIVLSTVFGKRQRHARAQRAELELVAGEGERRGAVAVAAVHRQRRQHRRAQAEERALCAGASPRPPRSRRRPSRARRRGRSR